MKESGCSCGPQYRRGPKNLLILISILIFVWVSKVQAEETIVTPYGKHDKNFKTWAFHSNHDSLIKFNKKHKTIKIDANFSKFCASLSLSPEGNAK